MEFNVAKCKVMHLGRNNQGTQHTMRGKTLITTEEENDMGVKVTKSLKPAAQ